MRVCVAPSVADSVTPLTVTGPAWVRLVPALCSGTAYPIAVIPSAVEKSKITSAACKAKKEAIEANKTIEKKRFICTLIFIGYKITAKSRYKHNKGPKKVINNHNFSRAIALIESYYLVKSRPE